jgi:hypothetical protein
VRRPQPTLSRELARELRDESINVGHERPRMSDCFLCCCRIGATTGGPSFSIQLMVNMLAVACPEMSTRASLVESAPYFPALVASS